MTKILNTAINGFGRIGRLVLRADIESDRKDVQITAINDTSDLATCAHLLKYDSVHGRLQADVDTSGTDILIVNGRKIKVYSDRNPENIPWGKDGIDLVHECTGAFTSKDKAQLHINAGAKRVLISAPGADDDLTVVYGVNHKKLTKDMTIVSNASCTTNCLAPVASVLHDTFGIDHGFMTTIHAYTGDQRLVDASHRDPHRGRSAALSMIPTSTGAAKAVGKVIPELAGKLDGVSVRVPTPNVSMVDFCCVLNKSTSVEDINEAIKKAANGHLKGVMTYYTDPLVSIDFNHDPHSSIIGINETKDMDGTFARIMAWYDNEWAFSNRMLDTASYWGNL